MLIFTLVQVVNQASFSHVALGSGFRHDLLKTCLSPSSWAVNFSGRTCQNSLSFKNFRMFEDEYRIKLS